MNKQRKEFELALAAEEWGWKYHHMGVPTTEKRPEERYIPHLKFYVSGFETSPFGVEWMRFDSDCEMPEIIQRIPHLAFEVEDVHEALRRADFEILTAPNAPVEGITVAMILDNGAPIELISFSEEYREQ